MEIVCGKATDYMVQVGMDYTYFGMSLTQGRILNPYYISIFHSLVGIFLLIYLMHRSFSFVGIIDSPVIFPPFILNTL